MKLGPKQDSEREQEVAAAIEKLRKAKQFILFASELEPGEEGKDDLVHFAVCGDLEFVLLCSSHMSRHAMAVILVPEMMGVEYLGEDGDS